MGSCHPDRAKEVVVHATNVAIFVGMQAASRGIKMLAMDPPLDPKNPLRKTRRSRWANW